MNLIFLPWMPPEALRCAKYAFAECSTTPHAAAGPDSGPKLPSVMVSAVTPGGPAATGSDDAAALASVALPAALRSSHPVSAPSASTARNALNSLRRIEWLTSEPPFSPARSGGRNVTYQSGRGPRKRYTLRTSGLPRIPSGRTTSTTTMITKAMVAWNSVET